jgi:hypothetical protein
VDSAFEGRIGRLREANTVAAYRNQAAARFMASGGNSLDGGQAAGGVEALLKSIDKRLESFGASIAVHP